MRARAFFVLSSLAALSAAIACSGGEDTSPTTTSADGGTVTPGTPGTPGSDCASGEAIFAMPGDGGATNKLGGVAVDATNVYFVRWDGSVWKLPRCAAAGTEPSLIGSTPVLVGLDLLPVFAIDSANAYVASQGGPIAALPLTGGAATTLVPAERVAAMISDGTHLYYTTLARENPDGGNSRVSFLDSVPVGGGTPTVLTSTATEAGMQGLAIDSTHAYYADRGDYGGSNGGVYSVPLTGGTPTPLTTDALPEPWGVSLVDDKLYVCDQGGPVYTIPTAGGAHAIVGSGINNADYVAVTPKTVYYTNTLVKDAWILHETLGQVVEPTTDFHGNADYPGFGGLVSFGTSIYFTLNGTAYTGDSGTDGGAGPMVVRVTP